MAWNFKEGFGNGSEKGMATRYPGTIGKLTRDKTRNAFFASLSLEAILISERKPLKVVSRARGGACPSTNRFVFWFWCT